MKILNNISRNIPSFCKITYTLLASETCPSQHYITIEAGNQIKMEKVYLNEVDALELFKLISENECHPIHLTYVVSDFLFDHKIG